MMLVEGFFRLAKAFRNFRNPLWLLAQRSLGFPVVSVTDKRTGLRFRCLQGADRMFGEIFHDRVYDIPMCPVSDNHLVIDIGANHGFASCHFASKGATVIAFEPSADVHRLLVSNIAQNGLSARIQAVCAAVGAKEGTALFYETAALGGGMSTVNQDFAEGVGVGFRARGMVEVRSIRQILDSLGGQRIRLLKIDCEGSELEILSSLTRDDLNRIDSIALEYHPQAYRVSTLIEQILAWESFVVSKVPPVNVENANLQVVSVEALRAWSRQM